MGRELVIIGAGAHGKVVADTALMCGYRIIGFLDDDERKQGKNILGIPVIGTTDTEVLRKFDGYYGIIAIGDNIARAKLYYLMIDSGLRPATLIHPYSYVSKYSKIGRGVVVFAGAVIQPGAIIGDNVIINTGASIDHDNIIMHHARIDPQATLAGGVEVGYFSIIHTNATVIPYKKISDNVIVGAGAVVIDDLTHDHIYVGVPAKFLKDNEKLPDKKLVDNLYKDRYHSIIFNRKYEGKTK